MDLTIQKGTGNDIIVEVTPSETQFVVIDRGIQGSTGATGATGAGVAAGGTAGQVLTKVSSTDYDTDWNSLGTMSAQNANAVAVTGGAIDGTAIGATTAAAGAFTTLSASGRMTTGTGVGAGSSATQVTIGGTLVSASNVTRAVSNIGTAPSTSTTEFSSFLSAPSTTAAAYTITTLNHFIASFSTLGATSAITNQFGHVAASTLTNATNNYGFYGNIASGTGRFNFYANGTAANVFAGTTSLGGLVGAESLRVTPVASAVNYLNAFGAVTTGSPTLQAQGSDTNIGLILQAKGTGSLFLNCPTEVFRLSIVSGTDFTNYFTQTGSLTYAAAGSSTDISFVFTAKGAGNLNLKTGGGTQFLVANTASAVNYLQTTGAATTGSPTISAQGSDANISLRLTPKGTGVVTTAAAITLGSATATTAGGSTTAYLQMGTTAGLGIYFGSGAPTIAAAQGSLYIRSDGSSTSTRMYINTNGSTGWTNVATGA
jgi:hypothetical protein